MGNKKQKNILEHLLENKLYAELLRTELSERRHLHQFYRTENRALLSAATSGYYY